MQHATLGSRVLIIEDEFFLADDLAGELSGAGYQVVGFASSVEKARQLAASDTLNADAAVVDINLGGKMIYPVVDILRSRGIKVVFSTGYSRSAIPRDYASIPVLSKPYGEVELLEALSDLD